MTENWARDLLSHAADTVPVGPPTTFDTGLVRHRRWPLVAAAASVILVVGLVVALDPGRQELLPRGPTQPNSLTQRDIPLTFGMTTQQATQAVQAAGFDPVVRMVANCTEVAGRVISVDAESVGSAVVRVGDSDTGFCLTDGLSERAVAWELIDQATGRGPGPDRSDRCCPQGIMKRLAVAATHWAPVDGIFNVPPELVVRSTQGGFQLEIGETINDRFRAYESVEVEVESGRVVSVRQLGIPHSQRQGAAGRGTAVSSEEKAADPDGVGRRFLDFALGRTDGLPVDTPVTLYLGNRLLKTIPASDADDRAAWRLCATYGEGSCPFSALETLARNGDHPLAWSNDPHRGTFCPDGLAPGPPTDTGGTYAVVLSIPEPQSCAQAFEVQVWVNDVAQIVAVNLLLGSP